MLSINNFFYIIPIRKENIYMALSRKHFREIARILGENLADDDLINEFVSFCASQNQYFQKQVFIDAIKKHEQKMRVENVLLSEERIEQTKREIDFLK
jgi:hypothetical protein